MLIMWSCGQRLVHQLGRLCRSCCAVWLIGEARTEDAGSSLPGAVFKMMSEYLSADDTPLRELPVSAAELDEWRAHANRQAFPFTMLSAVLDHMLRCFS